VTTAQPANTARLATSSTTSRRIRLTPPPLRPRPVGRLTTPDRQPTGTDRNRRVSRLDAAHHSLGTAGLWRPHRCQPCSDDVLTARSPGEAVGA
jgi:hypothetical protein